MSKLRVGTGVAALATTLGLALLPASCTTIYIDGECAETDHCYTAWNYAGNGTTCIAGQCVCSSPAHMACCPGGAERCENEVFDCRPISQCDSSVPVPVKSACLSDDQCAGPPDSRCGIGRCVVGICELEIWAGTALESQFPGDCKTTFCGFDGTAVSSIDVGDVPRDGNPCTYDSCDGDRISNAALPDNYPCPGKDFGICILGRCLDCSMSLGSICPGGLMCKENQCVPSSCVDAFMNGEESDTDCGGPICVRCPTGQACKTKDDCESSVCGEGICKEATCNDGVKNEFETGVDCGYPDGPANSCADGEGCKSSIDCRSAVCYLGVCQAPTCTDAVKNGSETGPDCGGPCPPCSQ